MFIKKSKLSFFSVGQWLNSSFTKNSVELDVKASDGFNIQRARCWEDWRKIEFMETFLTYPKFTSPFWLLADNTNKFKILDGANRMQALFDFRDSKFPVFGRFYKEYTANEKGAISILPFNCNYSMVDEFADNPLELDAIMIEIYLLSNLPNVPQDKQHLQDLRNKLNELLRLLELQK